MVLRPLGILILGADAHRGSEHYESHCKKSQTHEILRSACAIIEGSRGRGVALEAVLQGSAVGSPFQVLRPAFENVDANQERGNAERRT